MVRPSQFLLRMIAFLLAVAVAAVFLFLPLRDAFMANAPLNGLILGVLVLGVIYNFRQVVALYPAAAWIDEYDRNPDTINDFRTPRLLAPMATMLGERQSRLSLSALAMRSLLDGISSRLDESRDLARYTVGLLIFLGLLGTFWGLLQTVGSIRDVIGGLSMPGADINVMFSEMKTGLEAPLGGMGTAFSSSLFGLAGSLALGFLDLQASQAQNRFYNELEEWLSERTRLSSGALSGDGDQSVPAYVQALLEQTAESLENLQRTMARGEESRISANNNLMTLTEKISSLTDQMHTEQNLMLRLAEAQSDMKPVLAKLAEGLNVAPSGGMDETTRIHIRNLDVYVARLLEELGSGREEIIQQLRSEIKLLARTIAAVSDQSDR